MQTIIGIVFCLKQEHKLFQDTQYRHFILRDKLADIKSNIPIKLNCDHRYIRDLRVLARHRRK